MRVIWEELSVQSTGAVLKTGMFPGVFLGEGFCGVMLYCCCGASDQLQHTEHRWYSWWEMWTGRFAFPVKLMHFIAIAPRTGMTAFQCLGFPV